ncbi:MAG: hypothetical protein QM750_19985 [Rubrivivax sp.]
MNRDQAIAEIKVTRRARDDVRNPVASDPDVTGIIATLTPEARAALHDVLRILSRKWRTEAKHSWDTHKAAMAVYKKVNSVNARHLALALRSASGNKA